jgi:hypothetical protein
MKFLEMNTLKLTNILCRIGWPKSISARMKANLTQPLLTVIPNNFTINDISITSTIRKHTPMAFIFQHACNRRMLNIHPTTETGIVKKSYKYMNSKNQSNNVHRDQIFGPYPEACEPHVLS